MTDCLKQKNPTDLSAELKCDECIVVCEVEYEQLQRSNESLEAECKRLRTALKFYADEENYGPLRKVEGRYGSQWATEIEIDEGKKAKKALKESDDE